MLKVVALLRQVTTHMLRGSPLIIMIPAGALLHLEQRLMKKDWALLQVVMALTLKE